MMRDICLALLPALLFGLYLYGLDALWVVSLCIASALGWEATFALYTHKPLRIYDGTSAVGALILSLILPATLPWWMIILATLIMTLLGKEIFGGYGSAPFNGVLIAWVALHMSYPDFLFDWGIQRMDPAAMTAPIEVFKNYGPEKVREFYTYAHLLFGPTVGFIGQGSSILLLLGGLYLVWRRVINWRIPLSFLVGVLAFSALLGLLYTEIHSDPLFHLMAGGSVLAAFFLATDLPSTPTTNTGMIIFGLGAGILTMIIRIWGAWTFGSFFAVLIMNMTTPFLDKLRPRVYGR
jgi:electron transport complex protein RnfD